MSMPEPSAQKLFEAVLDAWDRHNTALLNLLDLLPPGGLSAKAAPGSPSVAAIWDVWRARR